LSLYLLRQLCYILPRTRQTLLRPSDAGNPVVADERKPARSACRARPSFLLASAIVSRQRP